MSDSKTSQTNEFLSTREAAAHLGVALSTVQAWVEIGMLPAWKTAGGHRRIPADAINAIRLRQRAVLGSTGSPGTFKVLVVEDDPVQREIYCRQFAEWGLPVQLLTAEDGFEGLMLIGRHAPDLVITDLAMPEMDGFKMIRRLKAQSTVVCGGLIVVTALTADEIAAQGGLPAGIPVYPKPIPFTALRPLIEHLSQKLMSV
jgi:excisionase family DNA binding protein